MTSEARPHWNNIALTIEQGLAEAMMHDGSGGSMVWTATTHREITELFAWMAADRQIKVLILTGAGERFCTEIDPAELRQMTWRDIWSEGQRMLNGYLNTEAIVIAAANGPAYIHAELLMMADIVLGCPQSEFADRAHFTRNIVPGDGAHTVWNHLLGPTRSSYYHLTGKVLDADEALRLGVLHEIHPRETLMERTRILGRSLADRPGAVLTYTKSVLRMEERRHFAETVSHGMAVQGLALYATGMRTADETDR